MTGDPIPRQDLIRSRCSTRDFLLSRTDPAQKQKPRGHVTSTGMSAVADEFPKIRHGEDFLHQASVFCAPLEGFTAVAVRIDHFLREIVEERTDPMKETQKAVAGAIDRVCSKKGGLWGILDADIFGGFFPRPADRGGKELAAEIRKGLAEAAEATISVGIAVFPTLDYDRLHILENALKALDHAAFFGPDTVVCFDAVSLNISGDQLYQEGALAEAAEEYRQALRLDPTNVNVHNSLGVCYGLTEDWNDALKAFEAALALDPEETMAVYNTGVIHMLSGAPRQALAFFRRAAEREPDIFEPAFQTGRIYLESGEAGKALPYLHRAALLNPEAAAVHRLLGEALEAEDDEDGAAGAYRQAVKKNPNDAAALSALGALLHRNGRDPEIAELFCRQSTEIEPENGLYLRRLGEILLGQGRFDQALEALEKAADRGTDCSDLMKQMAARGQN